MIKHELSQADVALATGLTQPAVSALVTGKTADPRFSTVVRLTFLPGFAFNALLAGIEAKSAFPRSDSRSQVARLRRLLENIEKGNNGE